MMYRGVAGIGGLGAICDSACGRINNPGLCNQSSPMLDYLLSVFTCPSSTAATAYQGATYGTIATPASGNVTSTIAAPSTVEELTQLGVWTPEQATGSVDYSGVVGASEYLEQQGAYTPQGNVLPANFATDTASFLDKYGWWIAGGVVGLFVLSAYTARR